MCHLQAENANHEVNITLDSNQQELKLVSPVHFFPSSLSQTPRLAFIFEVVIIRYDKVARDREIVTHARTSLDRT